MKRRKVLKSLLIGLTVLLVVLFVLPYIVPPAKRQPILSYEQMQSPAGKTISVNGTSIYVEDYSPTSPVKGTLVMVHGLGGSTYSWRKNVSFFVSVGYRVVAVDLKGFGLSSKDRISSYSHATQASILAQVTHYLEIDKAVFIGHSMGASVLLQLVHQEPQLVKALILVDGAASFSKGFPFSRLLSFDPLRRAFQDIISRWLSRDRLAGILQSAYYQPDKLSDVDFDNYYSRVVYGNWLDGLTAMTRDSNENNIDFTLSNKVKTLVVWGAKDTWVGRDIAEQLVDFTNGYLKIIPDAGHLSMEEVSDTFNQIVLDFLSNP